jgi:hypothetical protein
MFSIVDLDGTTDANGINDPRIRGWSTTYDYEPTGLAGKRGTHVGYPVTRLLLDADMPAGGGATYQVDGGAVGYHRVNLSSSGDVNISSHDPFAIDTWQEHYLINTKETGGTIRIHSNNTTSNVNDYLGPNNILFVCGEEGVAYHQAARWVGGSDQATAQRSFGYGSYSLAWGGNTAIGWNAYTTSSAAYTNVAIGKSSYAGGGSGNCTAVGHNAHAQASYTTAIGRDNIAGNQGSTVIGDLAESNNWHNIAIAESASPKWYGEVSQACQESTDPERTGWLRVCNDSVTTSGTHTIYAYNDTSSLALLDIEADSCIAFWGIFTAVRDTTAGYASYYVEGYVKRQTAASTTSAGMTTTTLVQSGVSAPAIATDTTNGRFSFTCTGVASQNWAWGGFLYFTEAKLTVP